MGALTKITKFFATLQRASSFYRVPYPVAMLRSIYLYAVGQFSRKEIIGYGLFVPSITARMPVLISKERSLTKLARLNPPEYQHLTENKDEFYTICRQRRLPIPETYGWTRDGRCYDSNGGLIEGERAWGEYLSSRLPEDFIIKDRAGAYGAGFTAFHRTGISFQSAASRDVYDIRGLLGAFSLAGDSEGIIMQKRLFDAGPLSQLSGRRGLQTMRINTLLLPDGVVTILFYWFKILAGHTLSDNFSMGTSGNLAAFGDPDGGILRGAVTLHACGSGMQRAAVHPETGIPFDGFRLPYWSEAIELAKTGQRCFPELPTLGWDIALTEDGPVIIEANARWDPPLFLPFVMSLANWRHIFGERRHTQR